jgi:transcription elongation factor GreA
MKTPPRPRTGAVFCYCGGGTFIASVISPSPRRCSRPIRTRHLVDPMLDDIRAKIEEEIERLTHELNVELPERIRIAVEHGDLRENAEYKSALERQQFVQARIGHLQSRMSELSKIDVKSMAYDRVGFGSRVKVKDHFMDEENEFSIVAGDYMDLDGGQVSIASPIGRGLLGAKEGEEVVITLPVGDRTFTVLELTTLPQQVGLSPEDVEQ